MKNVIVFLVCFACAAFADSAKPEEKVLKFSLVEWDAVKKYVDTNGYCRIANQNAAIVITNDLSEVEHLFPLIQDRLERNSLKLEGKRGKKKPCKPKPESVPYVGQGGW